MRNRHLAKIVLACLGILMIIGLQGSKQIAQVVNPVSTAHNPVYAVQAFYKAVERGDWLKARALTTGDFWKQLEKQGQVEAWQTWFKQDSSLEFTGFTVDRSKIDAKKATIDGRPVWVSAKDTIPRSLQTVTLEEGIGGWYISSIVVKQSSSSVESFYLSLNQGNWNKAKELVVPETWRAWEKQGLLAKIKNSYGKANPYVTARTKSSREEANTAYVEVQLVWMLPAEAKTQGVVRLIRSGDKWLIRQIEGGWPK